MMYLAAQESRGLCRFYVEMCLSEALKDLFLRSIPFFWVVVNYFGCSIAQSEDYYALRLLVFGRGSSLHPSAGEP